MPKSALSADYADKSWLTSIVTRPESVLKHEWYWLICAGVIVAVVLDWCAR